MFTRLLLPLDGSKLAESALPPAVFLAKQIGSSVTLIHIIEKGAPKKIHGEEHLSEPHAALDYLRAVTQRWFPPDIMVEQHVHTEEVHNIARSIIGHVHEFSSDLIIMCSHGGGDIRKWLFGSIAQQVISAGKTPALVLQPEVGSSPQDFCCHTILVPVDAHPEHEKAVTVAGELANALGVKIHLLHVIPNLKSLKPERAATGRLLPVAMAAMLDFTEENAWKYLEQKRHELSSRGVVSTSEVRRGDPGEEIARSAQKIEASMIVLGTHGKTGQGAFWAGSVASKVFSLVSLPLLLVPTHK
ncbi:MAG TPA: universal stress protein [Anaerolineaceae bacterium]